MKSQLREKEASITSAVKDAVNEVEKERNQLEAKLENANLEKQNAENALRDKYKTQIRDRDDAIERLKDMKAKLSTKMVGESLEQHCEIEFNKLRSTAFPRAYFEKDNDASSGSKGDYVFKDFDENGTEIVSIMFEMKKRMTPQQQKVKTKIFLENSIRTETKRGANMLYWSHCWSRKMSSIMPVLLTCFIAFRNVRHPPSIFHSYDYSLRNASMNSLDFNARLLL